MGYLEDGGWREGSLTRTTRDGRFRRPDSQCRNWITPDGSPGPSGRGGFPAASGRYHLYVSLACPWAHRTLIFRQLKDLAAHVGVDVVDPILGPEGWKFATDADGATGDRLLGKRLLSEIYVASDPHASGKVTVPVLWDRQEGVIVSNESAEIIRMFNSAFDGITGNRLDFYPEGLRAEIDATNERVYHGLNNGVYRAGFARRQEAYDLAAGEIFETLDWLEERLARGRYVVGDALTEADWRVATTLFRFDIVYHGHFKCNRRRIVDYPNLWRYARELYQVPRVAGTVSFDHIARHYYISHESINPTRIVPLGPDIDWLKPHGRGELPPCIPPRAAGG